MKTFSKAALALAAAVMPALISCNKTVAPSPDSVENQAERFALTVGLGSSVADIQTKGTSIAGESSVNSLQVLVFRGDNLDAYGSSNTSSATVSCTAGDRTVYAVVNAPSLSDVSSLSALKSKLVDLSSNSPTGFVMVGNTSVTLPDTPSVSVEVARMVSRIAVHEIARDFEASSLQSLSFTVDGIYLVNAAGNAKLDGSASPSKWYNEGSCKDELEDLLSDAPAASIANGSSYSTAHYFYSMPNPATVKSTLLVVEATLGTRTYYYPVELPSLSANTSYEISKITIRRPGSDSPEDVVSSDTASFSISIKDWSVSSISEKII